MATKYAYIPAVPWQSATYYAYVRTVAGALLNSGGDVMTHVNGGLFSFDLTESLASVDYALITVYRTNSELQPNAIWYGSITEDSSLCFEQVPPTSEVTGGGGGGGVTSEDIDAIAAAVRAVYPDINNAINSNILTLRTNGAFSQAIVDMGDISTRTNLIWMLKERPTDPDASALIWLDTTTGLKVVRGAAATAGDGSISVEDQASGDITIRLKATVTAQIPPGKWYDAVKIIRASFPEAQFLREGQTQVQTGYIVSNA